MKPKEILDVLFSQEPRGRKQLRTLTISFDEKEIVLWEQNPNTSSEYARRAKEGERIAWGFYEEKYYLFISDTDGATLLGDLRISQYEGDVK